jgi:heme/copper-type cytochrome/quinol oxidase subunit 3
MTQQTGRAKGSVTMLRDLGFRGLAGPSPAALGEVDEDRKVRLGMLFYVLNDVILAIFLIGSYIFLRGYDTNLRWFPPGTPQPPYFQGTIIMVIAVAGAVAYAIGEIALHRGQQMVFRWFMALALLLYFVDLAGQVWLMGRLGFTVQDGSFASSYIMLSGYHVYHMAVGVFLGIGIVNRAFRGLYEPRRSLAHAESEENGGHGPVALALRNTTGIASIGYYWFWVAIYAVAFWLLIIIQLPVTGR